MKKNKTIFALFASFIMMISVSALAQDTAVNSSSTTVNTSSTTDNTMQPDSSRYYWIGGAALVVIGLGVGYMVRMRRKPNDHRGVENDSINNPASGI